MKFVGRAVKFRYFVVAAVTNEIFKERRVS
jgi:hypothetical protein